MACIEAIRKKFKRIFSSGNENNYGKDYHDSNDKRSRKKKRDNSKDLANKSAASYASTKKKSNNCCCAGKNCGGDDDVEICAVNFNPYSPIDEIATTAIDKDARKARSKGSKIRRILRFGSGSCSKESSVSSNEVILSLSSSLQPLELTSSTAQSRNRYKREFHELELIGTGEFGSVYRCVNRLDGCVYAIKRSRQLARSNYAQRRAKNEVHANAVLNNHPNVVRYYSAWIEDDRMSIQQEYCNGGDLNAVIEKMRRDSEVFDEEQLCRLMIQLSEGLRYVHGLKLAHMDLKPENVFITKDRSWIKQCDMDSDTSDDATKDYCFNEQIAYKIGDLGHVTSLVDTIEIEDEGDCRFLPREILREDYTDLAKADIFALGLTIYEVAGGGPLPKNGPEWHHIRDGELKRLGRYSDDFNELLRAMTHPDPKKRPSATDILKYEFLSNGRINKQERVDC